MPWSDEDFLGNAVERVRTAFRTIVQTAEDDCSGEGTPSDRVLRLETAEDALWSLNLDSLGENERVEAVEKQATAIEALPDDVLSFADRVRLAGLLNEAAAAERRNLDPSEIPSGWSGP